ncbi:triosephosphate isomerase, cytosolic [Lactuca sativa]|uniref:triosephosphate isomerase, cytosolic n=1 Tax=Lactuca sativa TaxID=4236 RepID=UPI0022AFBEF5|nr:triosephosphate isomerase, cytosolic [Lactuca sativa]
MVLLAKIQKKEGIPWHQQILIIDGKILEDEVVVSPPFVFLTSAKSELRPEIQVAAQNCWVKKGGAFTGEVSAEMLANLGVPWVILGHSERRALWNETNEFVGDKVAYALSQGLKVIACVGETLEQREAGTTMEVVAAQTKAIAGNYFKTKLASTVCQKSKILFYL